MKLQLPSPNTKWTFAQTYMNMKNITKDFLEFDHHVGGYTYGNSILWKQDTFKHMCNEFYKMKRL